MIGILVFGTPGGFEVFPVLPGGSNAKALDLERIIDLPNTKINIFPNTEIYRILRVNAGNRWFTIYCKYIHALEVKNTRGGTFLGSGVICEDYSLPAKNVLQGLDQLTSELQIKMLDINQRFKFHIKDIEENRQPEEILIPSSIKELEKLDAKSQTYNWPNQSTGGFIFTGKSNNSIETEIDQILASEEFALYSDIFVFESQIINEYVQDKNVLKDIGGGKARIEYLEILNSELRINLNSKNNIIQDQNLQIERLKTKHKEEKGRKKLENNHNSISTNLKSSYNDSPNQEPIPSARPPTFEGDRIPRNQKKPKKNNLLFFQILSFLFFIVILIETFFLISDSKIYSSSFLSPERRNTETIVASRQDFKHETENLNPQENSPIPTSNDSCVWIPKNNVWVYTGNKIKTIEELIDYIIQSSKLTSCANARSKLIISLETNKNDIKDGKIVKVGGICFILPQGFRVGEGFNDFKRK
jgi:hypothetical protein